MQEVIHLSDGKLHRCLLPASDVPLLDEITWGRFEELLTPAYWAAQCWMTSIDAPDHYRLGRNVREELLACLLGGYGIPAEVGLAAYERLRPLIETGQIQREETVRDLLLQPLVVGDRQVRYRFANQKSRFVSAAFEGLDDNVDAMNDRELRDHLLRLRGVGLKTASWVVRNSRRSDEVAILDIHLLWVGRLLGIFRDDWRVERDYLEMEARFLEFAKAIQTSAAILDSVMWMTVRRLPMRLRKAQVANRNASVTNGAARNTGALASLSG